MNKEDKELQEYLIDEMMKVSKTNPDVMIYMGILMKNYEKLEEEIKILKEEYMILQNASDKVEEEKDEEIERLNNIINELEEYFIEKDTNGFEKCYIEDILYKIKELKENNNEDN